MIILNIILLIYEPKLIFEKHLPHSNVICIFGYKNKNPCMYMLIRPNFARKKTSLSLMDLTYACFSKCPVSRVWPPRCCTCNLWVELLQVKKKKKDQIDDNWGVGGGGDGFGGWG